MSERVRYIGGNSDLISPYPGFCRFYKFASVIIIVILKFAFDWNIAVGHISKRELTIGQIPVGIKTIDVNNEIVTVVFPIFYFCRALGLRRITGSC
ncbi:hypothetical protein AY599_11890 [Leptolyngbya valderiana BDU 20041]|nr:hypothetical protein AY599_11890 [Leptolyngbya valderiana BDU 20041]